MTTTIVFRRYVYPIVLATVLWNYIDASLVLWLLDCAVLRSPPSSAFVNQTIWITGASSGIGASVVCELVRAQARHVVLSARRVEKMQQVIEECVSSSSLSSSTTTTFSIVRYDAMDEESTASVVHDALLSTPDQSIDILILNSGIYQVQPAQLTSAEFRRQLFRVNVQAPIDLSQEFLHRVGWKGHIVVVSSMTAKGPQSLATTYGATKAALKSYFQSLSTEVFETVIVTSIVPGATSTELWNGSGIQPDSGTCMTSERVAQLLVRAMAINHHHSWWGRWILYEVWIAKAPALVYAYMSHYTPTIFYFVNHLVGLARMEAWKETQMDMLELPSLLKTLVKVLWKKFTSG